MTILFAGILVLAGVVIVFASRKKKSGSNDSSPHVSGGGRSGADKK